MKRRDAMELAWSAIVAIGGVTWIKAFPRLYDMAHRFDYRVEILYRAACHECGVDPLDWADVPERDRVCFHALDGIVKSFRPLIEPDKAPAKPKKNKPAGSITAAMGRVTDDDDDDDPRARNVLSLAQRKPAPAAKKRGKK